MKKILYIISILLITLVVIGLNYFVFPVGKLHLLFLHLPIGFLILAAVLEIRLRIKLNPEVESIMKFVLTLTAWAGGLSALFGWLLWWKGDYSGNSMLYHQCLGSATAVILIVQRLTYPWGKYLLFGVALILILWTGHFGGSLTHGDDFLFIPPSLEVRNNLKKARVYSDLVAPIFTENCNSCHNHNKRKGGLVLSDREGIMSGGKSGPVILPGDPSGSLLIQLLELPPDDELHMPPAGKVPLATAEVSLLKWWIETGAPFEGKIVEIPQTPVVENLLKKRFPGSDPLRNKLIRNPSETTLSKLLDQGFKVEKMAPNQPYLSVDLSRRQDLSLQTFKDLRPVSRAIVDMDLTATNLNEELLKELTEFPHIQKLRLGQTDLKDEDLGPLEKMDFVEMLDLSQTQVDIRSLSVFKEMKRLDQLNLRGTRYSGLNISRLQAALPNCSIEFGKPTQKTIETHLFPPTVDSLRQVFRDSLRIALSCRDISAEIRYTLDGSEPNATSLRYSAPFLIKHSTQIKAKSFKPEVEPSETFSFMTFRTGPAPKILRITPPNPLHPGAGEDGLVNCELGTEDYRSEEWYGYSGSDISMLIDLKNLRELSEIRFHFLEDNPSGIFLPERIEILGSTDGKNYEYVSTLEVEQAVEVQPLQAHFLKVHFYPIALKYLKIRIKNRGKLPEWHEYQGEQAWLFLDEILLE